MRVVSRLSAGVNGGRMVGSRRASIDFPVPGETSMSTLCPLASGRRRPLPVVRHRGPGGAQLSKERVLKATEKKADNFGMTRNSIKDGLSVIEFFDGMSAVSKGLTD